MSALESEAKPLLEPLIFDEHTAGQLGKAEALVLARWITKTMLMFQFVNRDGLTVPPEWYGHLRVRQEPPPGMHIWIAPVRGLDGARYRHHRLLLTGTRSDYEGYANSATVGIGHLAFQVVGHTVPDGLTFDRKRERQYSRLVWPFAEHPLDWPPDDALTVPGWDMWADAFLS